MKRIHNVNASGEHAQARQGCALPRLSIVWDMTVQCPWSCPICCMNAEHSARSDELTLEQKLRLVREIADYGHERPLRIDFSGGEVFAGFDENILVIEEAARLLGRANVGLSTSGYGMTDARAERLSRCISSCEMTMDVPPGTDYALRQTGYAMAADSAVPLLRRYGIRVGIQTVLTTRNASGENLERLFRRLCELGVDDWSFIPFFRAGRGAKYEEEIPEQTQRFVVAFVDGLVAGCRSAGHACPTPDYHYSMPGHAKHTEVCRCVTKSVGILPEGSVVSCFWGLDGQGKPLDKFLLGNVKEASFGEIMASGKAQYWCDRQHHCELAG